MTAPLSTKCEPGLEKNTTKHNFTCKINANAQLQGPRENICLTFHAFLGFCFFFSKVNRKGDLTDPLRGEASVSFCLARQSPRQGCHIKGESTIDLRSRDETRPSRSCRTDATRRYGGQRTCPSRCRPRRRAVRTGGGHA